MEPRYAFSIPSTADDTPLDCRIYHSRSRPDTENGPVKGAIVAHPYPPLGGCYDDQVVLTVVEALLQEGYVVGTFNFRGAGDSAGSTTWTGKAEIQDYESFVGLMVYYLHCIHSAETKFSRQDTMLNPRVRPIHLLLGGYSYGALVLARLPATTDIIRRFQCSVAGTAAAEIILRAQALAKRSRQALLTDRPSSTSRRGRKPRSVSTPAISSQHSSPMTMGGNETNRSGRRRRRNSNHSVDVIRQGLVVPQRVKAHVKHLRRKSLEPSDTGKHHEALDPKTARDEAPAVATCYILISPVLMPFSETLLPPGMPSFGLKTGKGDTGAAKQYLRSPTVALFGMRDAFTPRRRLNAWADQQAKTSSSYFGFSEVDGGHFWSEPGVLTHLQRRVAAFARIVQYREAA